MLNKNAIKNVLVTGATGFIGGHLISYLLEKKLNIRVVIRSANKSLTWPAAVDVFHGDLTDKRALKGVCENIDTVFHVAGFAHASEKQSSNFSAQHLNVNYRGTKHIFEEAVKANVKNFIYFSSVKAVGDNENCIDESWLHEPTSPYGIAKRQSERFLLKFHKNADIHLCILRPSLVYGPGCKGNLANMLGAIDKGFFLPIPKINNVRSMISVLDILEAAFLAATEPQGNGKIYFVTDNVKYSTYAIYALMTEALGKKIPKWHIPFTVFKSLAYMGDLVEKILKIPMPFNSDVLEKLFGMAAYNSQRIQDDLGFKPGDNLKKILPLMVKHYKFEK